MSCELRRIKHIKYQFLSCAGSVRGGSVATMAAQKDLGAYIDPNLELPPTGSGPLDGLTFAVKDLFDVRSYID